jgi:hypothetical protein
MDGIDLRAQIDNETFKGLLAINGGGIIAMSWSRRLSKTLHTIDGKTLQTLNDARAYAVALPGHLWRPKALAARG